LYSKTAHPQTGKLLSQSYIFVIVTPLWKELYFKSLSAAIFILLFCIAGVLSHWAACRHKVMNSPENKARRKLFFRR
jgi:hypothetical protein